MVDPYNKGAYHGFALAMNLHYLMEGQLKTVGDWFNLLPKVARGEIVGPADKDNERIIETAQPVAQAILKGMPASCNMLISDPHWHSQRKDYEEGHD